MPFLRPFLVSLICLGFLALTAQENCANGIDDDGDGLVDLNDTADCDCVLASRVVSLLPNPSLENFDPTQAGCESQQPGGLPDATNQANCLTGWQRSSFGTTDAWNAFTLPGAPPLWPAELPQPLPSGTGLAGFWVGVVDSEEGFTNEDGSTTRRYREYLSACFVDGQRTQAGLDYRLEFQIGFGFTTRNEQLDSDVSSPSPVPLAIYGIRECEQLDFGGYFGCPEEAGAEGWELITELDISGDPGSWTAISLELNFTEEYAGLAIGGGCGPDPGADRVRYRNYYFIDDIVLARTENFGNFTAGRVSLTGQTVCDDNIVLTGSDRPGSAYQWYKDGIAIAGATDRLYRVPAGPDVDGRYRLRVSPPAGGCAVSEEVVIQRPVLVDEFADSVALCSDTVFLTGNPRTGARYRWSDGSEESFLAVAEPGEYSVTISNACLQSVENFTVVRDGTPTYRLRQQPTNPCPGDTVTVSLESRWYLPFINLFLASGQEPVQQGDRSLTFVAGELADTVLAFIATTCNEVLNDTLPVATSPPLELTAEVPVLNCENPTGTIRLIGDAGPAAEFMWQDPLGGALVEDGPELIVTTPGAYTVEILDGVNCPYRDTFLVVFDDDFAIAVAAEPERCGDDGGARLLSVAGGQAPYSFSWSDSTGAAVRAGVDSIGGLAPGSYALTVTDATGCELTEAFTVDATPPLALSGRIVFDDCRAPDAGRALLLASGGTPPYRYRRDGGEPQVSPDFAELAGGSYRFDVVDSNGCVAAEPVELSVSPPTPFTLALPERIELNLGDSVLLPLEIDGIFFDFGTASWTPATGLSCVDCPLPTALPLQETRYTVTFTSQENCIETASTLLVVDRRLRIYAPTAFNPDGRDDDNRRWRLFPGPTVAAIERVRVYNRWGGMVWEGGGEDAWDGTVNGGRPANSGVFVYTAEIRLVDGRAQTVSGDVTLVR